MTNSVTVDRIGSQTPRLHQCAQRAVASAGDDAIEFAESIGGGFYVLDDWQKYCIRGLLAEDAKARLCAGVGLILMPRQNGKNSVLEVIELYAFYVLGLPYILHTAHLQETTADHMARLWSAIESDEDLLSITKMTVANGKEKIWRTDTRANIKFKTRSKKIGRGGSPRMVVFDEALYLTDDQIQAMLPSLSAQSMRADKPILIYTSSAPVAESIVLHRVRSAVLAGQMPDAFYAEWSLELVAKDHMERMAEMRRLAADRDGWYAANPGMGIRIDPDYIAANELPMMSLEAFLIERLGVVFDPGTDDAVINPLLWASLAEPTSTIASHKQWALSVAPDRKWSTFGVAGRRADGRLHVEWLERRAGTSWVVDVGAQLYASSRIPLRVHKSGPEGSFIDLLRERGVEVTEVSSAEVAASTGQFIDACNAGGLRHLGQTSLDLALKGAVLRTSTDGAALWSQRNSQVEITPLMACTVAAGGVPQTVGEHVGVLVGGLSDFLPDEE